MTGFDYVVFLIVAVGAIGGFFRGFVEEILAVAAWCISLFAVHYLHEPLTQLLTPYLENETGGGVLAFVLLLIVPYGITRFIARRIGSASRNSVLGPIDRLLGFGFGAVKGFIIVVLGFSILVFGYDVVWGVSGRPMWISQARTYPFLNAASEELMTMIADRRAAAEADAKADEAAKAKKDKAAAHKKAAKKSASRHRADTSADKED
ncbi:CvpA family protein [Novosphingobium sp. NBM11]|jgi:membrane protein required for colicin V production|uniref:CvpA family protein n=1 Tax=unclassified Novosphingobium TaxID=2644732 RepID=UPI00061C6D09|nr:MULTISPECIES: CvpA family protein [unclassified Novosphingobium]MBF5092238.1 CvpA family protein [Novosphingobium sp. NBM11]GAO56145.1 colicin V production protein [Novosphingobium sp. MD-1]